MYVFAAGIQTLFNPSPLLGIMGDVDYEVYEIVKFPFPQLSEQRRNDFTTYSQKMLDHYNKFKVYFFFFFFFLISIIYICFIYISS